MIHHDYVNAGFWGTPAMSQVPETIAVIIDIANPVRIVNELISQHIYEGDYCEELKKEVIKLTCISLLAFVTQEKTTLGTYAESMDKALHCLMDYQLPVMLASDIFHQTENAMMKALLNVVPEIDDERKYKVLDYKIIPNNGLYLTLEVKYD